MNAVRIINNKIKQFTNLKKKRMRNFNLMKKQVQLVFKEAEAVQLKL